MTFKEWAAPGIVIALISGGLSISGSWYILQFRTNQNETSIRDLRELIQSTQRKTDERLDSMDKRLYEMGQGAISTARLEEQNKALRDQISDLRADLREVAGKSEANYYNLNTRLAKQGL